MSSTGRPRDESLDRTIVDAAVAVLLSEGCEAITFSRVAEVAGTTRPALYRRFTSPADLAITALHAIASGTRPEPTGDHLADLSAELTSFRDGVTRTNSITLVGSMLLDSIDPVVLTTYRELIVQPRRARLAAILAEARELGQLTGTDADIDVAVTMCTGSFYAYALAGTPAPPDWPTQVARLVWRAAGGSSA
jgi:AcrR family transcriptional regulator